MDVYPGHVAIAERDHKACFTIRFFVHGDSLCLRVQWSRTPVPRSGHLCWRRCLSDRQIWMLGNHSRRKIHNRAHGGRPTQVPVNQKPDIAREGWDVAIEPDKIMVSVPDKAG